MPDNRAFREWFRKTYGEELYNAYLKPEFGLGIPGIVTRGIPEELNEAYQYWETNIEPTIPLGDEEDYLGGVGIYLESELKAGRISYEEFLSKAAEAERRLDEEGMHEGLPYFEEARIPEDYLKGEATYRAGLEKEREAALKLREAEETAYEKELEKFETEEEKQKFLEQRRQGVFEAYREEQKGLIPFREKAEEQKAAGRAYRPPLEEGEFYASTKGTSRTYISATQAQARLLGEEGVRVRVEEARRLGVDLRDLFPTTAQQYIDPGSFILAADRRLDPARQKRGEWQRLATEAKKKAKIPVGRPQRIARI